MNKEEHEPEYLLGASSTTTSSALIVGNNTYQHHLDFGDNAEDAAGTVSRAR